MLRADFMAPGAGLTGRILVVKAGSGKAENN